MTPTDPTLASALVQSDLIRHRQLSPLELTQLYLARIDRLNPQLAAFCYVDAERAIANATRQTATLMAREPTDLPPLFGLPTAIKDLNPVAGMPCAYGVEMLRGQIATADDAMAMLVELGGCNMLGKTAIPELASFPYTEPPGWPPTRNPWNLDYTAGGSSGGAAAAVAAHLLPLAPGSDGGGSLRGPAHCCGLVAIKPSRGRISDFPVFDRLSGLASNGPIARNVADAAALLDVLTQPLPGDGYYLPSESFLAAATEPVPQLRIGLWSNFLASAPLSDNYQRALAHTAGLCEELGHRVEPIAAGIGVQDGIDASPLGEPFVTVWQTAVAAAGIPPRALGDFNRWLMERSGSAGEYLTALYQLQAISRRILAQCQAYDAILAPVYTHSTIRVGAWAELEPPELLQAISRWIAPCPVFNATGQPVVTLPVALEPETNLPIGVQLVGGLGQESRLIAWAAQLEAALGFSAAKGQRSV